MSAAQFQQKYEVMQQVESRLQNFKKEHEETTLVLNQIEDIRKTKENQKDFDQRKCYRSVGGSLVETTAGEVIPHLNEKLEKLTVLVSELQRDYDELSEEIRQDAIEFQKKNQK
ncbi:hypothetical protein FOG51_01695 [Hanseniaspora uvarum]|jgi:chaperonin cofactor prefoldin|uniref:Prefoldin subunit 2 n=1 Tax=Hanseniaspora uvarum TaxID=29833 RepID=A0A1E5R4G4_HANUV|nr:hypothetical protein FOG48_03742 [Hanseniaspora uvarum]KAF0273449.1 hypothetical protein FOG51_01695 [Hanseniaspora uvarum]KAF0275846.1 hypothetical protein FOG50_03313 [Hanseniaspora uvarum]OEJ81807.1 hypothetical protein AWRI3580_g3829 [Hanseniaspora uvarum]GMM43234.1 hypothetical protein DAHU10_041440 [Hanseniaspora uvarum]